MSLFKEKEIALLTQETVLANRHISLRPTRLCISLWIVSLGVWVGAANYQVNVAYLICFWILCFTGIAALLTRRQLLGLHIHIDYTDEVFAGQTTQAQFRTDGSGKRPRLFWLRSEWAYDIDENETDNIDSWQRCEISGSRNGAFRQDWYIPIKRRGYFPRPLLLRLATSAPFGLFHAECRLEWQTDALAYPAPLAHHDFGSQAIPDPEQTPQQAGMHGEDIAYLKNHQDGISLQHIAWKVYAKRGELMDKVFDEPPPMKHSEIISYRDYPAGTPTDKLASLLTHRVLQAEQIGVPYTLELPNTTLTPQNQQREKCLNALALM
ncbi:MAG: DUF58 domain-containing protein [Alysiella sp.]|uniref:DUF58 domain-containing protein n=1 Tax=Alysiella sp. TaxID=1872483 RepID=UPI0026DCFE9E|nr:DUF58 domain-containing protein [Alysiella sp.]MDO4433653.1 DUF58 domain-containing protein [Alysiella sp.]